MTWPKQSYTLTWGRTQEGSWALASTWVNLAGCRLSGWGPHPPPGQGLRLTLTEGRTSAQLAPERLWEEPHLWSQRKMAP